MRRWTVVILGLVLALGVSLAMLTGAGWVLNELLHPVLTQSQIMQLTEIVRISAIVGIIIVGITGAAAIIVRTDVWTPLARALALWDFAFALAFVWVILRPILPAIEGQWRNTLITVLLLIIAARRVWVILRVDAMGIPAVIRLAEETKRSAQKTERLAQQTLDASSLDSSNPDKLGMARSVSGDSPPTGAEPDANDEK